MYLLYLVTGFLLDPLLIPAASAAEALKAARLINKRYKKAVLSTLNNSF